MLKLVVGVLAVWQACSHDDFGELRVVCVGCSTGIGRAAAEILLQGGAQVVISSRSPDKAQDVAKKFPSTAHLIAADASDATQLSRLAVEARKQFGQAVTSVIWAPTALALGTFQIIGAPAEIDGLKEQMNVNVYGLFSLLDALKADLIAVAEATPGSAAVIAVSSVASVSPIFGSIAYSAAKAAQDAVISGLALEFGALGVRFNSVLPGVIETPIIYAVLPELAPQLLKDAAHRHVLGRNGQPEECGHIMAFLLSQKASFITGQAIRVDGGASLLNSHVDLWSEVLTDPKDDRYFPIARKWTLGRKQKPKEL